MAARHEEGCCYEKRTRFRRLRPGAGFKTSHFVEEKYGGGGGGYRKINASFEPFLEENSLKQGSQTKLLRRSGDTSKSIQLIELTGGVFLK